MTNFLASTAESGFWAHFGYLKSEAVQQCPLKWRLLPEPMCPAMSEGRGLMLDA